MSYNKQYGHVDRATLNRLSAELEEKIAAAENAQPTPEPTPDPEPTGETTDYEAVCNGIGGSWDSATQVCSVDYIDEMGTNTREYDTAALDIINECTLNGGTWSVEFDTCSLPPTPEEECISMGGTWDPETETCVMPEPDPVPDPEEPGI